jgi:hypothetical protein
VPQIIKRGSDPRKTKLRMICSCGTEALFERREVQGDQRDGDYVVCPVCGSYVSVRLLMPVPA